MSGIIEKLTPDERRLAELGYKQELKRGWSGFSNFAISFSIISILAGCFTTCGQAWLNDGPVAISIGWPLARALQAGVLSINSNTSVRVATPFGGFKQSGYGRELGPHALEAYTELKSIFYATE